LLQDDESTAVWDSWGAAWRDVVVLDGENKAVYVYNLTDHNLSDPANYSHLKAVLVAVAQGAELPAEP
jgi:PHD/YefM family antitoxin component YafN of YafNO toxin-antitoxin module